MQKRRFADLASLTFKSRAARCLTLASLAAGSAAILAPALIGPATAQVPSWEQAAAQAGPLYSKALQFFAIKNYQSCIECCKIAAKGDPRNKNIPHLCALAYSEMGDTYNANIQFRAALTLDYNFVECHNNYGIFLNKKGEPEEAKKQFKECIRLNPRYAKAYYNLGSILQAQADLDGAVQQYRQAVAIDPNYFDAQRDLGLVLFQKFERGDSGEISESLDKLLAAERLVPDNPMIHYHLGYIYCCNGDLDEGETELRKALMADTQLAAAHYELGRLRYLRGDPNRALFEVKVAQKINPMLAEAKKYPTLERKKLKELQAKCEELTENYDDAIASWNEVASLTANNAPIKKHMSEVSRMARNGGRRDKNAADPAVVKSTIAQGISETEEGNLQAATQTFTRASEMDPKNFIPCQNLGLIYEAQDQLEQAIPMYQRALDLKPKYDGLYYNMAYVLEGLNRRAEAGAWYKRFHDLAGKYPYDPKHIVSLQQEDARVRAQEGTH